MYSVRCTHTHTLSLNNLLTNQTVEKRQRYNELAWQSIQILTFSNTKFFFTNEFLVVHSYFPLFFVNTFEWAFKCILRAGFAHLKKMGLQFDLSSFAQLWQRWRRRRPKAMISFNKSRLCQMWQKYFRPISSRIKGLNGWLRLAVYISPSDTIVFNKSIHLLYMYICDLMNACNYSFQHERLSLFAFFFLLSHSTLQLNAILDAKLQQTDLFMSK